MRQNLECLKYCQQERLHFVSSLATTWVYTQVNILASIVVRCKVVRENHLKYQTLYTILKCNWAVQRCGLVISSLKILVYMS